MLKAARAWTGAVLGAGLGLAVVLGALALIGAGLRAPRPAAPGPAPAPGLSSEPVLLYLGLLLAPVAAALGGAYGWRLGVGLLLRPQPASPEADHPIHRHRTLIIGYGNTLRRDDGAGVRVAEQAAARDWPGVAVHAVHQLVPELAEMIAEAGRVIFVDAGPASPDAPVAVRGLTPAPASQTGPALGHTGDPEGLLGLARDLFGHCPDSVYLVTVPAVDFDFGETLSQTAERGVNEALEAIAQLIGHDATPSPPSD